ncbi:MAG: DUF2383 domain-containing protein [Akkermansiaceae bacterium]
MSNTPNPNEKCIDVCNSLLAGEISAVETYDIAIKKFEGHPVIGRLSQIRNEHTNSVSRLRQNVVSMGGEPKEGSGIWGATAKAVQHGANLFGKESTIESLQTGEKLGQMDYEDALKSQDVLQDCKSMIADELLPKVNNHIITLEQLEEQVD